MKTVGFKSTEGIMAIVDVAVIDVVVVVVVVAASEDEDATEGDSLRSFRIAVPLV